MPTNASHGSVLVDTDAQGCLVLPGNEDRRFRVEDLGDGNLLLHLVRFNNEMQDAYDNDPELRAMLDKAMSSPTVYRDRRSRRTE